MRRSPSRTITPPLEAFLVVSQGPVWFTRALWLWSHLLRKVVLSCEKVCGLKPCKMRKVKWWSKVVASVILATTGFTGGLLMLNGTKPKGKSQTRSNSMIKLSQETTEIYTCPAGWYLASMWVTLTLAACSPRCLLGVSAKKWLLSVLSETVCIQLAKSLCAYLNRSDPGRDGYRGKLS